jgi:hypothetical protein
MPGIKPKSGQKTHRKVNMPDHNDQCHPHAQDGNVAGLVQQVADIAGGDENPIRQDGKDRPDHKQGNEHPVIADVLPEYLLKILEECHGALLSFVARCIIFSWVRFFYGSSPVISPPETT